MRKKVALLGYYDDYARFYCEIERKLESLGAGYKVYHYYTHFSGFLYAFLRLKRVCWISVRASFRRSPKKYSSFIKLPDKLQESIRFHSVSEPNMSELRKVSLISQVIKYERIIREIYKKNNFDVVILPGDARIVEIIFKRISSEKGSKTFYFEQGPYGTTLFDAMGVNANASFRDRVKFKEPNCAPRLENIDKQKKNKYKRNPFYRAMDIVLSTLFKKAYLYPPDIVEQRKYPSHSVFSQEVKQIKGYDQCVLLVLQVVQDANFTHHSPYFSSHFEMLKNVREALPESMILEVREHPKFIGNYEAELYNYIDSHENIVLASKKSLSNQIKESKFVIVNNSTTGMDAVRLGKKVVILGDSYYDQLSSFIKVNSKNTLNVILNDLLKEDIGIQSSAEVESFVSEYFINGHYQDSDLKFVELIAEKIHE